MLDLDKQPGGLFVVATLLPLASFLILLLAGTLRNALRRSPEGSTGEKVYLALGGDVPPRWPAYVATLAIALAFLCSLTGFVLFLADNHGHANDPQAVALVDEIYKLDEELHDTDDHKRIAEIEKKIEDKEAELAPFLGHHDRVHRAEHKIGIVRDQIHHAGGDAAAVKKLQAKLTRHETDLHDLQSRWQGSVDWLRLSTSGPADYDRGTALQVGFKIDHLSGVMFVMVTLIATLIHVFSVGYMSDEEQKIVEDHQVHGEDGHLHRRGRFGRFFMYLSLFCFSMLNLVLADNLFQVFVSWELVGICSYLLIGFYYERQSASNASNKAFITNRIGDAGFIIGLLVLWTYVGTLNFDGIFSQLRSPVEFAHNAKRDYAGQFVRGDLTQAPTRTNDLGDQVPAGDRGFQVDPKGGHVLLWEKEREDMHALPRSGMVGVDDDPGRTRRSHMPYWLLVVAGLGIFLGCVGKSAQFPLQVWLPDAMEGPTPVSALIHAATMVAAGVYLVGRCYPLFTAEVLLVIAYTGAITLFVAATIAIVMTDIKKVLAYSTVSQLGFMMLALGVGGWTAGLFHLVTHAFFKALLFLGSGSVIYGCHHEQEMTKMGGLYPKMKITGLTMLMGVLAIAGTPGFSGWYSKDAVLGSCLGFAQVHPEHYLLFLMPLITAGITAFYMFRMWFMTFTGEPRDEHVHEHAHESPRTMTTPLIVLAVFSVCVGWGWPFFSSHFPFLDPHASWLEHQLHHAQPMSVKADFGTIPGEEWAGPLKKVTDSPRWQAHPEGGNLGHMAGNLALGVVLVGFTFASLLYYYRTLDPAEAKAQFPRVHAFLAHKWYFDELYSVMLVRPALAVAHWCRLIDSKGIDTVVDTSAAVTVQGARWSGKFDNAIIDGAVNLVARVCQAIGGSFRHVQTGYLRSYVLFLVLAAVGLFLVLRLAFANAG